MQQWTKDTSWGNTVKDHAGFPSFALIHKSTGQALRHGSAVEDMVSVLIAVTKFKYGMFYNIDISTIT